MTQNVTLVSVVPSTGNNRIETPIGTAANPFITSASSASQSLTAGTNRSGTATTTSAQLAPANTSRRGLNIQNIGANNIGINEFGGAAAIGTAGTYTIAPGASANVRTTNQVNVIAATASTAFTATEF
jgi:hypothetical protein